MLEWVVAATLVKWSEARLDTFWANPGLKKIPPRHTDRQADKRGLIQLVTPAYAGK